MKPCPPSRIRLSAFTLIELLTVIAIIAILMGLLFPAITIVKDSANKVKARTDLVNTVASVKQYFAEYGKYPVSGATAASSTNPADLAFGDPSKSGSSLTVSSNNLLFDVLRNYPNGNRPASGATPGDGNPRQIVFFEGKTGTSTANGVKGGFATTSNTTNGGVLGAMYDPWGTQYTIEIDANYDNFIVVPYNDFQSSTTPPGLNYGCVGWSLGKDLQLGTKGDGYFRNQTTGQPSDDVITWQ